jgi:hypothetical protein
MSSDTGYGPDVTPPGVELSIDDCPLVVRHWCWSIAFLFQNGQSTGLEQLIPRWAEIHTEREAMLGDLLDCGFDELRIVVPYPDVVATVVEFETASSPEQRVFVFSAFPLRRGPKDRDIGVGFDLGLRFDEHTGDVAVTYFEVLTG